MSLAVVAKVGTQSSEVILLWGNHPAAEGQSRRFKRASAMDYRGSPWEPGVVWKVGPVVFIRRL